MSAVDEYGTDDTLRLRAFGFDDVHPLWGGRALWATGDLNAEVRVVEGAGHDGRYHLTVTAEEWSEIERLVVQSGLLELSMSERNGAPDEGRPVIRLITDTGEELVRSKWQNDTVLSFDSVFDRLRSMAERIEIED